MLVIFNPDSIIILLFLVLRIKKVKKKLNRENSICINRTAEICILMYVWVKINLKK